MDTKSPMGRCKPCNGQTTGKDHGTQGAKSLKQPTEAQAGSAMQAAFNKAKEEKGHGFS